MKRIRSQTPKKKIDTNDHIKNKENQNKYFSKDVPNSLIKSFKNIKGSTLSPLNLTEKLIGKTIENVKQENRINTAETIYQNLSKHNNNKGIKDLTVNTSKWSDKEKEFKNIISNINLKELQKSLEKHSLQLFSEDINN
jgi:succinate dehydrogenase/fumarate reductase-like Fe-S protein